MSSLANAVPGDSWQAAAARIALAGGTSVLGGGKFADGAVTAAFAYGIVKGIGKLQTKIANATHNHESKDLGEYLKASYDRHASEPGRRDLSQFEQTSFDPTGQGEGESACVAADSICESNAFKIHDNGYEKESAYQMAFCRQASKHCYDVEQKIRDGELVGGLTPYPPSPAYGGVVRHRRPQDGGTRYNYPTENIDGLYPPKSNDEDQ